MAGRGWTGGVRAAVAAAATVTVVGIAGCEPTDTGAVGQPSAPATDVGRAGPGSDVPGPGGACVFVKPDGAQKFGHVGWGFRVTGTDRWVYGAVENPSGRIYTPPGGDIGAWHAEGTYARMLGDMSRDANYPGSSEDPYSRYRCIGGRTGDVTAARAMIDKVERRGFLVGIDPRTGEFGSRDCLDATYDVLKAYKARRLTPAYQTEIPNVWVASLVLWTDKTLKPQ
ncbi:hypothetical protein [Streptomyces sp. NPDC050704]|uniref:hypothetical protein n=1 Tax=Streptomyces sp. NPDC050704 TaxID=3157219 RepID=UPI003422A610